MRLTSARPVLSGLALALTLAGCSGGTPGAAPGPTGSAARAGSSAPSGDGATGPAGNGVATDPVDRVLARASRSLVTATSFHVQGDLTDGSTPITLDLRIRGTQGARGRLRLGEDELQVLVIGRTGYFSAGPAFWRKYGGEPAVRLLRGKFLKASTSSKDFADFLGLTDPEQLAHNLLPQQGLARGSGTVIDGLPAREFTDGAGGSYFVAEHGDPVPLKLVGRDGKTSISMTFGEYGATVDLTPPPASAVVEESRLKR
jgi:hypothetical protein